jgi:hypothetical protein
VQLFLIVNVLFFFAIKHLGFTDFTPLFGDHSFFVVSDTYSHLWFLKGFDAWIVDSINQLGANKAFEMGSITTPDVNLIYSEDYYKLPFTLAFREASLLYSKTLIFMLIPLVAAVFFLPLAKRFKYLGASFIFSVHFVSYYLLAFSIYSYMAQNTALKGIVHSAKWLLFDTSLKPYSTFFAMSMFEFVNLAIVVPWLFFAFRRLFQFKWYINLPVSYLLGRVFFMLTFSFYKKILVALTVWLM